MRAIKRHGSSIKETELVFKFLCGKNSHVEIFKRIQWFEADLLDSVSLTDALEGVDEVYHCAALVSFKKSDNNALLKTNVEGTAMLVNLCIERNIKKFGYISSVAALSRSENGIIDETMPSEEPSFSSFYSRSKFFAEMEVWRGIAEGLKAVIVNPGVILGFGDFNKGSLKMFGTVRKGLPYYPMGSNGYVDGRDIARILVELMQRDDTFGKRYPLVSESIFYKDLFAMIAEGLHVKAPSREAGKFLSYLYYYYSSIASFFMGKSAELTKAMVDTSMKTYNYDSSLIMKTLEYTFIPIQKTIGDACVAYLELNK